MPAYNLNPLSKTRLALPGTPVYLWGSFDDRTSPSKMTINHVAITSNVATITVQVIEGNVPVAGQLVTVTGVPTASGAFNVSQIAIGTVTIDATSGTGTLTYALTHADVGSTAASGLAVAPPAIVPETVNLNDNSIAVALPMAQDGKSITGFSAEIIWTSGTSAGAMDVQTTDDNANGGNWSVATTITYPATRYDPAGLSANFVRLSLSTALVGATTVAGRVLAR